MLMRLIFLDPAQVRVSACRALSLAYAQTISMHMDVYSDTTLRTMGRAGALRHRLPVRAA